MAPFALRQHQVIPHVRVRDFIAHAAQQVLRKQLIDQMPPADSHALPGNSGLNQQRVVIETQAAWARRLLQTQGAKQPRPIEPTRTVFRAQMQQRQAGQRSRWQR